MWAGRTQVAEDQAGGPLDMERSVLLLRALLVVPQGELDDTHFEKLQGRLISYTQGSSATLDGFLRAGAVDTIQEGVKNSNFRVVSVCWRLLGKICRGSSHAFERLSASLSGLFDELLVQADSPEPLVRNSTLSCLLDLTHHAPGHCWLNKHSRRVVEIMLSGYRSESHFVGNSAVELLSELIRNQENELWSSGTVDLCRILSQFLENPMEDADLKKRTLNLLDLLMQHEQGLLLVQRHRLMEKALPLLFSSDRLVKASLLELLASALKRGYQRLFASDDQDSDQGALQVMHDLFWSLFCSPEDRAVDRRTQLRYRANMLTALELGTVLALWPSALGREFVSGLFRAVACIAKNTPLKHHQHLANFVSTFHPLFVLKALHMSAVLVSHHSEYGDLLSETAWMSWLLRLLELHGSGNEEHGEDPRVIKLSLEILQGFPSERWNMLLEHAPGEALTSPGYPSILYLMRHTTDRAVLMSALALLRHLFANSIAGIGLLHEANFCKELNEIVRTLAVDWNWELRESATSFVAYFFEPSNPDTETRARFFAFAISAGLHHLVSEKLRDSESYVRAAALVTLSSVTRTQAGWQSVIESNPNFLNSVITTLTDTEAFVKRQSTRAALDLLKSWLDSLHTLKALRETLNRDDECERLRNSIDKTLQDFDWEVKVRGVRFLHTLLLMAIQEDSTTTADSGNELLSSSTSTAKQEEDLRGTLSRALFVTLGGDRLLLSALRDYERLVRLETARLLGSARLHSFGQVVDDREEQRMNERKRLMSFCKTLHGLDLAAIERDAGPRREEDEDDFFTRHIAGRTLKDGGPDLDDADEEPFLDCPF